MIAELHKLRFGIMIVLFACNIVEQTDLVISTRYKKMTSDDLRAKVQCAVKLKYVVSVTKFLVGTKHV